jgi:hypothetical protein
MHLPFLMSFSSELTLFFFFASRKRIAYFAQSDKSTLIETKNSPPITAGDYLLSRIQSNFEAAKKKKEES